MEFWNFVRSSFTQGKNWKGIRQVPAFEMKQISSYEGHFQKP